MREAAETLVLSFAPMMPHLAEECWKLLGHRSIVAETAWPESIPSLVATDHVTIAVQVNGKRRDEIRDRVAETLTSSSAPIGGDPRKSQTKSQH